MSKKSNKIWFILIGLAALLPAGYLALLGYIIITATPLHPDAQSVPSVTRFAPLPPWVDAVKHARELVRTTLAEKNLPGLSVAVSVGGDIVWAEGFGWANLEKQAPVAPETRFRIGTASTVLTSAGIGLLLERGQLKLDDKIQTYVPEFPEKPWPVTLRQLMGHVAGVRTDSGDEGPLFDVRCERPVDALPYFKDSSLLFEPGTQFRYSSYGWILMSAAIDAVAPEPFLSFMRKQIFEPLGMKDTAPDSERDAAANAAPYFPRFAANPKYGPDPMRPLDYSCYAGSSVFVSTPSDLVRFGVALNGGKLLQPATVQLLQTSQRLPSGQDTGYGLGWDLENVTLAGQPTTMIGHDGDSLGGMVASLMTFRDQGIVLAVTSNTSYADTYGIGLKLAEVFARGRPAASK